MRVDCVLIARRDIPRQYALALVLRQLVQVVGNFDPVARGEQIQMKRVLAGGLIIEPIEVGLIVSDVVVGDELRRIEKASAANTVDCQEVAELGVAVSEPEASTGGAEGAVARFD